MADEGLYTDMECASFAEYVDSYLAGVMRRIAWTIDERRKVAARMYQDRTPMDKIAGELGVSTDTVSRDLSFSDIGKNDPRGRPRSANKPVKTPEAAAMDREMRAARAAVIGDVGTIPGQSRDTLSRQTRWGPTELRSSA